MSSISEKVVFDDQDDDESSSGVSVSHDDSTPTNFREREEPDERKEVEKYSSQETKDVCTWKFLVIMLLVVVGSFASATTLKFIQDVEHTEFVNEFDLYATAFHDDLQLRHENVRQALAVKSRWISAQAKVLEQSFPNVTLPTFEVMAQSVRSSPGIESLVWAPLLTSSADHNAWQVYAVEHQSWISQARALDGNDYDTDSTVTSEISGYVFDVTEDGEKVPSQDELLAPAWQVSPPPTDPAFSVCQNLLSAESVRSLLQAVNASLETLLTSNIAEPNESPRSFIMTPIVESSSQGISLVGLLQAVLSWENVMRGIVTAIPGGIEIVLRSSCSELYTFTVYGLEVEYVGAGDLHNEKYDSHHVFAKFYDFQRKDIPFVEGHCFYSFHIYPTQSFEDEYKTDLPILVTVAVAALFGVVAIAFLVYDFFVLKRNQKIVDAAARSNAIVASVFPATIRDRLFEENENRSGNFNKARRLKNLMHDGLILDDDEDDLVKSEPIADLFPEVTLFFADICGFTAWSSTREPGHVFILLESIYAAFDLIAKKRRIFKVETVGDCYVAACGLPDPRPEHAVAMARFARDCVQSMRTVVQKLELKLGPGTGDLGLRVGLHSGQVTAGVLRGDRSRFQLFGDAMNTASRMESTGQVGRIHISKATADLLQKAGKGNWFDARADRVVVKGKGQMETYWLKAISSSSAGSTNSSEKSGPADAPEEILEEQVETKKTRLTTWAVEIMQKVLLDMECRRASVGSQAPSTSKPTALEEPTAKSAETVLDEVEEIIHLPHFRAQSSSVASKGNIALDEKVAQQLQDYTRAISSMYNQNAFHNFEHALHVMSSTVKLLNRIRAPEIEMKGDSDAILHDSTFGITSDPLTQFACIFSALIHDVDHKGVPNTQLIKEQPAMASTYKNRSVAEQVSVDLAWELLQDEAFVDLQKAIYQSPEEKQRFRQLVVNSVMATDIVDKELKTLRNGRWNKAFQSSSSSPQKESTKDAVDRKATIVIEHLIQASDVSHTMQHWHVFRKWNERLFEEMRSAYKAGRAETDPATFWYQGEIGFFDFYIIPLAKKLKECGVFGVSSDEYLNYAVHNREEWSARGMEIVAEMAQKYPL
uniref:Phosphodiesterase n=1 Tax=Amphora coffeiformis TaxID=265554 RepID=A0A7S3L1G7_9STRA|mmetsp:Transcript_7217/g.14729  ORF Transcript_7217/g.14729 Transcript_7217/m.14729 type:complete len:1106 (-) Transcript_7217:58-3375(-)